MPVFQYEAVDVLGATVKDKMEASTELNAINQIKQKQLYLTSITEIGAADRQTEQKLQKMKLKELSIICRQLSTLLSAGVTVIKSLDVLNQQLSNKNSKQAIGRIYENIQRGEMLSEAFRRQQNVFPELLINMVAAGEESGTLDTVMEIGRASCRERV